MVSSIGNQGREKNKGNRSIPITRALTDTDRILSFLTSEQGIAFALQQNINIPIQNTVVNKNGSLIRTPQRFGVTYNPLSTLAVQAGRLLGQSVPNILIRKSGMDVGSTLFEGAGNLIGGQVGDTLNTIADLLSPTEYKHSPANLINNSGLPTFSINDTFTAGLTNISEDGFTSTLVDKLADTANNLLSGETTVTPVSAGDKMTLADMIQGVKLDAGGLFTVPLDENGIPNDTPLSTNVEAKENGMPFYFKDLRDNKYIFFRAFIEGLSENISPGYNPTQYIGRSEPVYTYGSTEREISMTLKLFAQTKSELGKIYEKMNKLTSLCYPEYFEDKGVSYGNRMKAPLTKLRIGELFGNTNSELQGYIKSLSYSIDQASPYETEVGKRVPKFVTATIGYQVIHSTVPNLETKFYGYIGD